MQQYFLSYLVTSDNLLFVHEVVANILDKQMIVAIVFVGCPLIEPIAICGGPF